MLRADQERDVVANRYKAQKKFAYGLGKFGQGVGKVAGMGIMSKKFGRIGK